MHVISQLNCATFAPHVSRLKENSRREKRFVHFLHIYFSRSSGKVATANLHFDRAKVKTSCKFATPSYVLVAKGKKSVANAIVLVAISSPVIAQMHALAIKLVHRYSTLVIG